MKTWKQKWTAVLLVLSCLIIGVAGCTLNEERQTRRSVPAAQAETIDNVGEIPEYSGEPYVVIAENVPEFTEEEKTTDSFEFYSDLDELGRCGVTYACLGQDLMPTEPRGEIGSVKPTGWHTVKYKFVDGKYLYNRCHLIGFQLSGENANERNLITGTRYMNTEGMLPFENMVADYIKETDFHVLYRVTPVFHGDEMVARGVHMEAYSVEDQGDGICFNVFVYNVQPGVTIDYFSGESGESGEIEAESHDSDQTYILNTNTRKFHLPSCPSAEEMDKSNKKEYTGSRRALIEEGYKPCKRCNP